MTCKSLFQASFEESLNLQDDSISGEFARKTVQSSLEKEKFRGTFRSYIWLIILTLIFVYGLNYGIVRLSHYVVNRINLENSNSGYNFLPYSVFWSLAILWSFIVVYGKRFKQQFILIYRGQFHFLVTYIMWLLIEVNLFFLTVFYTYMTWVGIIIFSLLIGICWLFIYLSRRDSLIELLYGQQIPKRFYSFVFERLVISFFKYGWGFVVVYFIFKLIFPNSVASHQDWLGFLGLMSIWFFMNIVIFTVQMYLFFPCFLQGYYKLKYPEAYREWEGKTVEEWYGKRYLSKKGIADDL